VRFGESARVFARFGFPVPIHVPALGVCFEASVLFSSNWSMAPYCPDESEGLPFFIYVILIDP
jgi:hypothetical protein